MVYFIINFLHFLVGSDIPGINSSIIAEAYQQLQNGSDMVLGPAADGGYYLVGISNSKSIDLKIKFQDVIFLILHVSRKYIFFLETGSSQIKITEPVILTPNQPVFILTP
jgi:hypothetical protein